MEFKRFRLPIVFLLVIILIILFISECKVRYDELPTLNVLMLHMVTKEMPEDSKLSTLYITDDTFRDYCEYFEDKYTIVSLEEAYDIIRNNKTVENPNLLAFTFDDGYDNNYYLAYPILKELDIKANINVIARYTDENYPGYLSWSQVKEMSDSGLVSIGSHTYDSHYYTTNIKGDEQPVLAAMLLDEDEFKRKERIFADLAKADNMISNAINKDINIIAYPYGVPPFDMMDNIRDKFGYNIQILVRTGVNRSLDMFSKLKRFTVDGTQSPRELDSIIKKYRGLDFLETLI